MPSAMGGRVAERVEFEAKSAAAGPLADVGLRRGGGDTTAGCAVRMPAALLVVTQDWDAPPERGDGGLDDVGASSSGRWSTDADGARSRVSATAPRPSPLRPRRAPAPARGAPDRTPPAGSRAGRRPSTRAAPTLVAPASPRRQRPVSRRGRAGDAPHRAPHRPAGPRALARRRRWPRARQVYPLHEPRPSVDVSAPAA